jgi:hypothetical protein
MAISKNSNGISGGEGEEPISAGTARQAVATERAATKASATSRAGTASRASAAPKASATSRIASRPARAVGDEMRSAAGDEGPTAPLGYTDRKYSFNTLLAAGFLGYVLGRLFSR